MTRWLIGLGCVVLGVVGLLVTSSRISGDECFRYDLVTKAQICGTPEFIEQEMQRQGKEDAEAVTTVYQDPINICKVRGIVQRDMHHWLTRYYDAYIRGCESAVAPISREPKDSNYGPALQHKKDIKEGVTK